MNVRTATVLEVDQDVKAARNAARGILAAASSLRAAGAADAMARANKVAAVAARACRGGRPRFAVSRRGHCRRARRAPAWHRGAARTRRRRRRHRRGCRHLLRARPRLRIDGDDLCDAPDQGRVPRPSRAHQRLVSAAAAPARQRTIAAGVLHHRRAERRRRPQQRSAHRPQRFAHRPGTAGHRHLLRQGGRRHRHHGAPQRRQRRLRPGFGDFSQAGLCARSSGRLGRVRHARHLQRRLQARRVRRERTDRAGELRQDPRPDHDAGRASVVERGLDRHRHRRGRSGPRLCPQRRATRRRNACRRPPPI